jgi:SAM-dependent methyltransferase
VLLRAIPEPGPAPDVAREAAPLSLAPAALPALPAAAAPSPADGVAKPGVASGGEIRAAVESAVGSAVETAVTAAWRALRRGEARNGGAPRSLYAEEWDRYEASWSAAAADEGRKVLGEEWGNLELEQTVFDNYCRPYLAPSSRVLEIGQGGGRFTARIAPLVERIVCLDVSANMLRRARDDMPSRANVSFVLSDGRGLAPIMPGSVDFCFAYDVFVHLDQEDIYLYLQDLRRVLRPGGRAVISFANLLDPLGFRQFEREAARHRTGRRSPGRINFLSPEIVRTLAAAAGLEVESLHLAANNRDVLAVLERGLS